MQFPSLAKKQRSKKKKKPDLRLLIVSLGYLWSNTNMRTQRTLTSLLKKENSEKVYHPHRLFFSLFGSGFFK